VTSRIAEAILVAAVVDSASVVAALGSSAF
jgi:hypothetical protein